MSEQRQHGTAESNVELNAAHSCDEMGCGSVGSHVLMTCKIHLPWSLSARLARATGRDGSLGA